MAYKNTKSVPETWTDTQQDIDWLIMVSPIPRAISKMQDTKKPCPFIRENHIRFGNRRLFVYLRSVKIE